MQRIEATRKSAAAKYKGPIVRESAISCKREIVYLVDDDQAVREGLFELLAALGKEVVTFGTGAEYLEWRRTDSAACLILDMMLPDMCGLDLQGRLSSDDRPAVIFISGRASIPAAVSAMKGGAFEFLTKPINPQSLQAAVEAAFAQDRQRRQMQSEVASIRQRFYSLTPREREVLPLIAQGLLNKQAAATLGISEVTLQVHRGHIMRKMAASSFSELVRMAEKIGIPKTAWPAESTQAAHAQLSF